ncbi:DNA-binding response regulator [Shewanella hanedai]|jgi:two-component system OmpR family response regulator|uniref:Response regulator transcription factor n=1 Tax=Shewanella hanedai TaxID=25 RepID=A0A553JRN6_SHEHA|nr:response regulator transcription factor [Shewanella hanedai]TRY15122.1 response regulator transcription factor [Shewanella hanedai]GGI74514.1 DNA-binding response regulator [Shewanella hanedai]
MRKVLLVDDDLVFRELLEQVLMEEGYHVIGAEDGIAALSVLENESPDLILLDIMMPNLDGFGLMEARKEQIPVIIISAIDGEDDRIKGYELGADDFLSKPFSVKELLVRMSALLRRVDLVRSERTCSIELISDEVEFDELQHCVSIASKRVLLTQTEFKLLKYLFERKGEVITKQELQRSVLQKELGRFDRNLDMHVSNTRKKLADIKLPKTLINTVRGQGYSFAT